MTAIRGDIGAALGWLFVGGIGLGVAAWHFVSKRDRSDDPDTAASGNTTGISARWSRSAGGFGGRWIEAVITGSPLR